MFDACVHILAELTAVLHYMPTASTSSETHVLRLIMANALGAIPCTAVSDKLADILCAHGWDVATQQFSGPVQDTRTLRSEIDALADRLLAN